MKPRVIDSLSNDMLSSIAAGLGEGDHASVEKISVAWKSLCEGANALEESLVRGTIAKGEVWKVVASILVPAVTVLTLAFTIGIQSQQIRATREAAEDLAWREMIGRFERSKSGGPSSVGAAVSIAAELKSFFRSERYG